MRAAAWPISSPGEFGMVLGAELARAVGARVGEKVALIAPQGQVTPAGMLPRLKQFTVVGIFEVGMYEYDAGLALVTWRTRRSSTGMGDAVSGRAPEAATTCSRRPRWRAS